MNIVKTLLSGVNKTNLSKEFFIIIIISLIAALLELLGLAAFSYLMATIFGRSAMRLHKSGLIRYPLSGWLHMAIPISTCSAI